MKLLISIQELEILKSRDLVPCECECCKNTFKVTKNLAQRAIKGTKVVKYCSRICKFKSRKKQEIKCSCKKCNNEFISVKNAKFCSQTCANKYYGDLRRKLPKQEKCLNCDNKLIHWKQQFCSISCSQKFKNKNLLDKWLKGEISGVNFCLQIPTYIVEYIWNKFNNKCAECGWDKINPVTKKSPLHIHHINGNSQNNKEENLQLLCPNCHALTPNFGRLNKNGTREKRRLHDL